MLLSAGVPLLEGLRIVKNISKRKEYESLIQKISEGGSLARAMRNFFPPMVSSSIEGAEKAGNLEEVLARLSKYYEDRAEVEEKIKSALIYPCFVIILCLVCLFVLFFFVLPGFKTLFEDLDAELPLFTRIIVNSGEVWYIPVSMLASLCVSFFWLRRTKRMDAMILKVKFLRRGEVIQIFRSLGSLLAGGIPIVEALNTAARSSRNKAVQNIIINVREEIENGVRLSEALAQHKMFPKESVQMLSVGENSGKLAEMLLSISDFYEKERETAIKRFTTMLEPAMTLFVGLVVGVIAIAMFLPMISMISRLQ
jgi:type IV pilus assembly protein PilC